MRCTLGTLRGDEDNQGNSPGDPGNPVPQPQPQDDPPTPS